jgi:ABC-type transport system involved in cytochrome c biogenesis permease component
MNALPIVTRELRVVSRQRSLYVGRTLFAMVSIAISLLTLMLMTRAGSGTGGTDLFYTLEYLAFAYCSLTGLYTTSDCISEEKRDGTLGLLFLTDLRGYDVILGKLAATSLKSLSGLLAILPVLGIPLLLGSVSGAVFARMMLILVNTMLLSLAVGMCMSVLSTKATRAACKTLGVMILLLGAAPIIWVCTGLVQGSEPDNWIIKHFFFHSAIYGLNQLSDATYMANAWPFWKSTISNHALVWFFMISASLLIKKRWQDQPSPSEKTKNRKSLFGRAYGSSKEGQKRALLLAKNPIMWRHSRGYLKTILPWSVIVMAGIYWLAGSMMYGISLHKNEASLVVMIYLCSAVIKCMIGIEAGQRLTNDRRTGALELLFSTPITEKTFLRGQWMAACRQFAGPVGCICALVLVLVVAQMQDIWLKNGMIQMSISHSILLLMDCTAVFWFGLWQSAKARQTNRAILNTLLVALLLPWIIQFLAIIAIGFRYSSDQNLNVWFLVHMGWSLGLILYSRRRLQGHLRRMASTRPGEERILDTQGAHQGADSAMTST